MQNIRNPLLIFGLAALGAIFGHLLGGLLDAKMAHANGPSSSDVISTRSLELVDAAGKRRALMAFSSEGTPSIWFLDNNGKSRLNIGLYGDGNAAVVLNDENEQAVQIFRTVGAKAAPVLVMKADGQDRIVLGLNDGSRDPFFVYMGKDGTKKSLFGHWP